MKMNHVLVLTLILTLIVVNCAGDESEVKGAQNTDLGKKNPSTKPNQNNSTIEKKGDKDSIIDSSKVDPVKKGGDPVKKDIDLKQQGVENSTLNEKNNPSKQLKSKENQIGQTNKNDNGSLKDENKKEKVIEGSASKEKAKEETLPVIRKENSRSEECDPSNMCTDEGKTLVACLRVPGNESPELSLLIQNKGKGPLSVSVSAPAFVQLERTQIQLREKEDQKVKVSIKNGEAGSFIVLTAGSGNCSLDFSDLIVQKSREETDLSTKKSTYLNYLRQSPIAIFVFFTVIFVLGSVWTCLNFRKYFAKNGSKYQKVEAELPVSGGGGKAMEEGWNNSWGDDWDDEEAPNTPLVPVTPNISGKGISSRRVNKEARKD